MRYGKIYKGGKIGLAAPDLMIGNTRPKFFVSPILETSRFKMAADAAVIEAHFFLGTPFETNLYAEFSGDPQNLGGRDALARVMNVPARALSDDQMGAVSDYLRGSQSLKRSAAVQLTDERAVFVDRGCLAYVSLDGSQFKRLVLMQMYAEAVLLVLEIASEAVFRAIKDRGSNANQKAIEQYEELLKFHGAHYFRSAVKIDSHELSSAWEIIRDHHKLEERMTELSQKLASIAMILKEKSDKEEAVAAAHAAKVSNRWALFFSALLTIMTGLTAFEFVRKPVDGFVESVISSDGDEQ